ncbi:VirD4-like conjugal transfer protein, CD1115 family [Alicyclobacillus macrosporangiidus]|uniref:Type IV secretory pathway, VirD4 component, TraG/TraD family ATPase n=1 Tax=Alicyclobacillus macrosporangiidus TaxID=392015 RepID=A0A1I7L2X3_9BACL|nr:type IV secretory system conjugative DNA transfer family protein [Alicyclobacillus macrosporangiidus]SFV03864.1 Type IV secretory pathway, VirD4 component, TraG/TraD family ATPase [Alicyclobacillus macrosporangiidus]
MQDRTLWLRIGAIASLTFVIFAGLTTLAGAFQEAVLHLRHLTTADLVQIKTHAEHGTYLLWAFTHPQEWTNLALLATGVFVLWQSIRLYRSYSDTRKKYKQRHGYASHGTAHWQEKHETRALYHRDNKGILLGDYDKAVYRPLPDEAFHNPRIATYSVHPFASQLNQQYIIFGPPGSQKTTGFILPNIFHLAQLGLSMVVTDPKGELYELTAEYARQRGYNVLVLDYLWFKYGHRQNLLHYIYAEEQYAELASMYLSATRNEGDQRDIWEGKAQELMTALIGYVHQVFREKGTLTDVYNMLALVANNPDKLLHLFKKNGVHGAPMLLIQGILGGAKAEAMMASVVGTLSEKLNLFTLSNVQAQTSATDFDLSRIADEKTILYVWISDSQKTYAPIISVFWTVLFTALYERARQNRGSLPNPVVCLMDEMGNIGKIADFDVKLTTMRSRKIYPMMIWHSYPQLKLKYGTDYADAIMGACDTKIILACGDMPTAELVSKILGDTTIETQSKRASRTILVDTAQATNQFTGRRLLQPAELMALDRRFSVVIQSGRPPVLLNKLQYRYWEYEICPHASLDDLPSYGLESNVSADAHPPAANFESTESTATEENGPDEDQQTEPVIVAESQPQPQPKASRYI